MFIRTNDAAIDATMDSAPSARTRVAHAYSSMKNSFFSPTPLTGRTDSDSSFTTASPHSSFHRNKFELSVFPPLSSSRRVDKGFGVGDKSDHYLPPQTLSTPQCLFPSSNTISANEKRYLSKPSAALGEKRNKNRAAEQVNQFDFDRFYSGEVSPQSPPSPADAYDWGKGLRYLSKDFEDCESSSLSSPIERR
jgi:hypothetical protein